jgi:UDP-N-acetylmuramoylalanine--D-glutamate ligase
MNIAIAGYGQEGKVSYDYWNRGGNTLTIASEQAVIEDAPQGVPTITGPDAFSKLGEFDLIIRSPGINPKKLPYKDKVWSATSEFFEKCPAPIIGVTGTKGKGTTSSLITSILRAAGRTVHLVGNIGTPALAELAKISEDDVVVYELSSFQLWDAKRSPSVAVVLPFETDHLDVHDSYEDYIGAKLNIARFQKEGDICIAHVSHSGLEDFPETEARYFEYPSHDSVYVQDEWFWAREQKVCPVSSLRLPGKHNVENASAAIIAATYALPGERFDDMEQIFSDGLQDFEGLPHRLKFVAEKYGVKYYDDSIATTPGSAIAALASFDEPKVIILGGHDKGADYSELVESCARTATTVLAIGSNGPRIGRMCREAGVSVVETDGGMKDIVSEAATIAQPGSVVILSPAAASFDMFRSYSDRGDQFVRAVSDL